MKYLIASDIHGSSFYCKKLLERFIAEKADKLILLGDILYHGPRNDLPREYAPKEIIPLLNSLKDKILCVRGNCDAEVDQMVLEFPILADYAVLDFNFCTVYATHGHIYNKTNTPPLGDRDILLFGHTHIPECSECKGSGHIFMNPGSVSIPKDNSYHSYMTIENGVFTWKSIEGTSFNKYVCTK